MDSSMYVGQPSALAVRSAAQGTPIPMTATGAAGTTSGSGGMPHLWLWVFVAVALGFVFFQGDIRLGVKS